MGRSPQEGKTKHKLRKKEATKKSWKSKGKKINCIMKQLVKKMHPTWRQDRISGWKKEELNEKAGNDFLKSGDLPAI